MMKNKGISLIVLVITIIVIIILAGAVILSLADNNPIGTANEAAYKSNISGYNSELAMAVANQYLLDNNFNEGNFNAGVWDGNTANITGTIKEYIPSIKAVDAAKFEIQNSKLVYVGEEPTEIVWLSEIEIGNGEITSAINSPVLATGMTPIKWNGSAWVATTIDDTAWYNYTSKQWANAQTQDGSMWVWIPRYEYKITLPHTGTAQTIAVNFLSGISTTATSGYTVHPGFTFGSNQLTGIWVAKFEASGTINSIDIKPSLSALRNITIDTMFTACRNMETTYGTRYGWGTSGTGIDTHLMKNTEWGVVAYLSQSIYGKNSEIWINPNSNYLTGQAGTSASASSTTSTYEYDNMTYGIQASTTGNIYGVYDMSGGAYEYTAAYVNNGNGSLTTYGSSLVNAMAQYKDVYTSSGGDTGLENYAAASGRSGDALYETSTAGEGSTSWYSDFSYMPSSNSPFFLRGGNFLGMANTGVFYLGIAYGGANGNAYGLPAMRGASFRPVLVLSGSL
jgi:hypothetical protein